MFTDLAGSTASAQQDEKAALARQKEQELILRPLFAKHGGREIKSTGDGFLVEFESALHATECAVEAQLTLAKRNADYPDAPLLVRIGVHLGDVEARGGDIFGDAVNIAARIEPQADPGGICLSEAVYSQISNKVSYSFQSLGTKSLKGLTAPIELYRVVLGASVEEGRGGPSPNPRLAVLPFKNISPDPRDEYFADGLTEELISALSQIRGLRVISRTSVNHFKDTSKPVTEIGRELNVDTVLEGSVRKAGEQLRITAQLIDARTDEHRWSQTFDRRLENVFAIQAEVAQHTAEALRLELLRTDQAAIQRGPTQDLAAYELYLQGVSAFLHVADEGWTRAGTEAAARYFEAAIDADPNFAAAYSYYANLLIASIGEAVPAAQVTPRIRRLVARALELAPQSADAHTARGNLALQIDLDYGTAEAEFRRAVDLNPSHMPAHSWYGVLLHSLGRPEESVRRFQIGAELSPLFQNLYGWQVIVYRDAHQFDRAVEAARRALERFPTSRNVHALLGHVLLLMGDAAGAQREAEFAEGPAPGAATRVNRAILKAALGDPEEARALVKEWESSSPTQYIRLGYMARIYLALGDADRALELLEKDSVEGDKSLWIDFRHPSFDPIRGNPRFVALLRKSHLPA